MKRKKLLQRYSLMCVVWIMAFGLIVVLSQDAASQDRRVKARISNAGFTITALPLLAAKDWGVFSANGLDVELIVMSPTLAAAAIAQGDIDYVAGVGPASVAATLTGLPSRDLVLFGQGIVLAAVGAAVQDDRGTQRQKDRDIGRNGRHKPCGTVNCLGEVSR